VRRDAGGPALPGTPTTTPTTTIKGAGDLVLTVVRERAGAIRDDVTTSRPADRWKLLVTCAPGDAAPGWLDVVVLDDTGAPSYPLAPTALSCGNRVVVPGAFSLTGPRNQVCARVGIHAAPPRDATTDGCVTIRAE
jgi:hypothetical protein